MWGPRFRLGVALIAAVGALVVGWPAAGAQTVGDIVERDGLIADQEALLNAYRCRFGIDTEAVTGGCSGGMPALPASGPSPYYGGPSGWEMLVRDDLIADQEALLNAYRCRFGIDTEAVTGGCEATASMPDAAAPQPTAAGAGWYPDPTCRYEHRWWAGEYVGWEERVRGRGWEVEDPGSIRSNVALPPPRTGFVCDQASPAGQVPPGQRIVSISAGEWQTCLLRADGAIGCSGRFSNHGWDYFTQGALETMTGESVNPLSFRFRSVSVGKQHSCGVRVNGTVVCWGGNYDVSHGRERRETQMLERHPNEYGQLNAPSGRFVSVSAGNGFSCGVRDDQTIACWGINQKGQTAAPSGRFVSVSSGEEHSCGVRVDQTMKCWGTNEHGELDSPPGQFTQVSAGFGFSCGVRADQTISCWGSEAGGPEPPMTSEVPPLDSRPRLFSDRPGGHYGELDAPTGQFTAVSVGLYNGCGLRLGSSIVCWGVGRGSGSRIPGRQQQFTAVSVSERVSCGVRHDGTALCREIHQQHPSKINTLDEDWPRYGHFEINVVYCVQENLGYIETDLIHDVKRLNQTVGEFFSRESSGLVSIEFLYHGFTLIDNSLSEEDFDAIKCAPDDPPHTLLLVDHPRFTRQFANSSNGDSRDNGAIVFTAKHVRNNIHLCHTLLAFPSYLQQCQENADRLQTRTVAHEVGHFLFGLRHPPDCSIMGSGYFDCSEYWAEEYWGELPFWPGSQVPLEKEYIGCRDRRALGWPEDSDKCEEPIREPAI